MIAVLGSNGMAGHIITRFLLTAGYQVTTVARNSSDIIVNFEIKSEIDDLIEKLLSTNISFVINCIGLLVQDSLNRPDRAIFLNGWLPLYLENELKKTNIRLIHISSDCVFDGAVGSYSEIDPPNETNIYGVSKAIGEINNHKDVTFRTSIIGPEIKYDGTGLFDWFLKKTGNQVNGWDNVFWSGVTTLELAKCIKKWIENPIFHGVYHLTNNKKISKFELLEMINRTFEANKIVIKGKGPKWTDKSLIDTRGNPIFKVNDYQEQLNELKKFMKV